MNATIETLENRQQFSAGLVVDPLPVILTPKTIHPEATDQFSGKVGKITGLRAIGADFRNLKGSIDWGDGTESDDASFSWGQNGAIDVYGSHTYAKKGNYDVVVNVSRGPLGKPGQPNPFFYIRVGEIDSKAKVTPDIDDGGVNLIEVATRNFTERLGGFDFRNIDLILTPKINWGDGKTSTGTLKFDGNFASGEYSVVGSHTYSHTGTFNVTVTIESHLAGVPNGPSGTITSWTSSIKVMGNA